MSLAGGRWERNLSLPKNSNPEQFCSTGGHSPSLKKNIIMTVCTELIWHYIYVSKVREVLYCLCDG